VYIWRFAVQDRHWVREELSTDLCTAHWQEVSWAPNNGLPFTYIAAGSADGLVVIWSQDGLDGKWKAVLLPQQEDRIGRLSWSHVGSFLLISCANGAASMWKEQSSGEWEQVSSLFSHAK
jgi:WD40 repeat protein